MPALTYEHWFQSLFNQGTYLNMLVENLGMVGGVPFQSLFNQGTYLNLCPIALGTVADLCFNPFLIRAPI